MSAIYPPEEHKIVGFTSNGSAIVKHGNHEVQARFSGIDETAESGQKKVSKEIARERQKVAKYDPSQTETTETTVGASPADDLSSHFTYEDPKSQWRRKERNPMKDFLKLKRKYESTFIPSEKERYYQTMLRIYGTTETEVLAKRLNVEMQADPRIDIRTHRGVIKTTVAMQTQFAKERLGLESSKKP